MVEGSVLLADQTNGIWSWQSCSGVAPTSHRILLDPSLIWTGAESRRDTSRCRRPGGWRDRACRA